MKPTEAQSQSGPSSRTRRWKYTKVRDNRKHAVRGLWTRNGAFLARLTVEGADGKKKVKWAKLKATTPAEATDELKTLQVEKRENRLRYIGRPPKLSAYIDQYVESLTASGKRPATVRKLKGHLARWSDALGHWRLDQLRPYHVANFLDGLTTDGELSPRTRNLYQISLRHVMKRAKRDGYLKTLPTDDLAWQPTETKARRLYTLADIEKVCDAGLKASKNGRQLADFLRLLAFSGCREQEALALRWSDVHFERKLLTVGAEGNAKNRQARRVDFNAKLETHLRDMHTRRVPDSKAQWMFASPQRGERDEHAKTFRESLRLAVAQADLPGFSFHDCRHHFISFGVMSGIDYMTLARWAGHQDGGVLIGKVYGHLCAGHAQAQAARLNFGPTIVPAAQAVNSF